MEPTGRVEECAKIDEIANPANSLGVCRKTINRRRAVGPFYPASVMSGDESASHALESDEPNAKARGGFLVEPPEPR